MLENSKYALLKCIALNDIIINGDGMKNKKIYIVIAIILVIAIIISIIAVLNINKGKKSEEEEVEINIEQLEMSFSSLFNNEGNEYVDTIYQIEDEKSGQYKIKANIPFIKTNDEFANQSNKEISELFTEKLAQILTQNGDYTKLNIDYATNINQNILSISIKCELKEGNTALRTIIKTYNYDIENGEKISINDIITEDKKQEIQNQINTKIEKQVKKEETIIEQGYSTYKRDKTSEIYLVENATEFYIKDNIIYIIYCYGNNNYTNEIDLIINHI